MSETATKSGRPDWKAIRDSIDLAKVATNILGPAPGRRGERGRKLWWPCPFHEDANPSFCVEPGKAWFRCYGCGEHGDAATLVMWVRNCSFPEAVAILTGESAPARGPREKRPSPRTRPEPSDGPEGMSEAEALDLVASASERLWSGDDRGTLAYLTGPVRLLLPETIREARLGFAPSVRAVTKDGRDYEARGVVIPWYVGSRLTLVKVRQPDGRRPKYAEVYRHRAIHTGIYPGPEAVRMGEALALVEGEFDALLLDQELDGLCAVATTGSASAMPSGRGFAPLLPATRWLIAGDADEAGDRAAEGWLSASARSRRVRPPSPFKDWTEAKAGGVDLRRWWGERLAGVEAPATYTWDEMSRLRWGDEPGPNLDVGRERPLRPL